MSILILFLILLYFFLPNNKIMCQSNSTINSTTNTTTTTTMIQTEQPFIELYTFPFIVVIGTVCNILTFLVMRRKKMRHQSTYFYMAVLAIADELVLLNGCLNVWIYIFFGESLMFTPFGCKIMSSTYYIVSHFSVWIVVSMTIERFIAVAIPLQASRLCTVKRAKLVCFSLACIMLLINVHFLFTHALINGECVPDKAYDWFMKIWPWIDAVIYSFIPFTLLIIFNILIVHNLIKASNNIQKLQSSSINTNTNYCKKRKFSICFLFLCNKLKYSSNKTITTTSTSNTELSPVKQPMINQQQQKRLNQQQQASSSANKRLTIMLLVVSITFFVTSVPIVTLQTLERNYQQISNLVVLKGIFLALQYLNHSINFFLYAVTGKTFRKEFLKIIIENMIIQLYYVNIHQLKIIILIIN